MDEDVLKTYGNQLRVRACGLCWQGNRLLMVNHRGLTASNFWAPPGGGVDFGQKITERLLAEFNEETGLTVTAGSFSFACEYIHPPIHAMELFFEVFIEHGRLRKGSDPELNIITGVQFMTIEEILGLPAEQRHGLFNYVKSRDDLKTLTGFFTI